ncbi:MAG: ferrous iron transport protein B [Pirellulales bacterium]|nr:ferrous iron transport protein B [Pirellulales bacterium]
MPAVEPTTVTVALVGNPNTGKSTLFTALAGVRQRIGNYPGVTVEKKIGHMEYGRQRLALVDLPGTYSLAPRSPDEMVAVDVLLGRQSDLPACDAVLCIVDASNLERNLYLVSQVLELGLPTIVALNMIDVARDRGLTIDASRLQERLGIPVVALQANKRIGIEQLKQTLMGVVKRTVVQRESPFPAAFQAEVAKLEALLNSAGATDKPARVVPRYLVERLLLDTSGYLASRRVLAGPVGVNGELHEHLTTARHRLAEAGLPVPAVEAMARYQWAGKILEGIVSRPSHYAETPSDRVDRVLTHRVWGTVVFAIVMLALFSSIFVAAKPLMSAIDGGVDMVGESIKSSMGAGALRSLLVDGIVGGVGNVIVFLPQILILFMFIAILEDCGYMARAAYLMDKLMVRVGLSGKSFIPLLSSFACAIPGIMATRVIENRRDRLTTILIAPLMSCSARLPVYSLLIYAFIPSNLYLGGILSLQGIVMFVMYLVGIVAAAIVALVLKRTMLRGPAPAFVMELPPYKFPSPRLVFQRMAERGWSFIRRAGTLIVAVAVVVWALLYYPHNEEEVEVELAAQQAKLDAQAAELPASDAHRQFLDGELARFHDPQQFELLKTGAMQRQSYLGRLGHFIEPVVRPLGWDWRVGSAVLASFPAREVVLGTLGVIYNLGEGLEVDSEAGQTQLQTQLQNAAWDGTTRPIFTVPMALGLMVFFALCAQCGATLVIIKRETGSWRWSAFTFTYMTVLAYLGALATYQIGSLF